MPAEARSHVVDERLRAGYRYLRWRDQYRPLLGGCHQRVATARDHRDEIECFTAPLCSAATPRRVVEHLRARAADTPVPLVVTACAGRLPGTRAGTERILRILSRFAPGPGVIVDLVSRPRFARSALLPAEQQARFEQEVEALAEHVRGAVGSHVPLTISQDTVDPALGPLPRFFYRAISFPTVDLGGAGAPAGVLTRALLGLMHDRPALAQCGSELAARAALLAGHAAVLRAGAWSAAALRRFLAESPREWTDPAQEPVAILMPEAGGSAQARRVHPAVEQVVAVLHGRLRLPARIASELDPLALDKQKLIVVAGPDQVSRQGALLLTRQLRRGRTVVAWSDRRSGALAGLPIAWCTAPAALLEHAVSAGVLPAGSRLATGSFLWRALQLGAGRVTGRLGPGGARSSLRWQ